MENDSRLEGELRNGIKRIQEGSQDPNPRMTGSAFTVTKRGTTRRTAMNGKKKWKKRIKK